MKLKTITEEKQDIERAYFGFSHTIFNHINISGPADGESAFKECRDIHISHSRLDLRYPCWHDHVVSVEDTILSETARAPFWYDKHLKLVKVKSTAVKAVRECQDVSVFDCDIDSEEFAWKSDNVIIENSKINGFYAFFESKHVRLSNVQFSGKYSFQYIQDLQIDHCVLNTKDAFWHTKNAIIKDSTIIGEYLGWHCENVTFIRCHIEGTQPLCYSKNVTFVDCTFDKCDLAFEYSEVNGSIKGTLSSIKNPSSGKIIIDEIPELIVDENDRSHGKFSIEKAK